MVSTISSEMCPGMWYAVQQKLRASDSSCKVPQLVQRFNTNSDFSCKVATAYTKKVSTVLCHYIKILLTIHSSPNTNLNTGLALAC